MKMDYDVVVVGGGQSGLALGYYLKKQNLDYLIVDSQETSGGAWIHGWDSLQLFSPPVHSSLPGWPMPKSEEEYPNKSEVISYLSKYEQRYKLTVSRPYPINEIRKVDQHFELVSTNSMLRAKVVILATGSWSNKVIPDYKGLSDFNGKTLHSGDYENPEAYIGKRTLIVGGGNSGAQIAAELSKVTKTIWVTKEPPTFLPPDVNGKSLFDYATQRYRKSLNGTATSNDNLGDIVQVPQVRAAKERDIYDIRRPMDYFTPDGVVWANGEKEKIDTVIWCTGFAPHLTLLTNLLQSSTKRLNVSGTKLTDIEGVWVVGYGNWTGFASATLIGVGRTAKRTILDVTAYLDMLKNQHLSV